MNTNILLEQLHSLALHGMAEAVHDMLLTPSHLRPSLESAVSKMIETEITARNELRTARLIKAAKLRFKVLIEDVICSTARNLTKAQLESVADCGFIRRGENLLITGLTGTGKSFLACAIGHQACTMGLRVLYLSMNHFTNQLKQARLDGTLEEMLAKLNKNDLIIFDDFGLQQIDAETRIALLSLLEDRYEKKSVIITSQLPLDKWYEYIAESTLADAIMDRLINSSSHIVLDGPSLRSRKK